MFNFKNIEIPKSVFYEMLIPMDFSINTNDLSASMSPSNTFLFAFAKKSLNITRSIYITVV